MRFRIDEKDDGCTVKQYIAQNLHISGKMLKALKYRQDGITVNGQRVTVRCLLRAGDLLVLSSEDRKRSECILPVDLPIEILYEDDDLIIPSKPANMPTHPSHDHHSDTVANALAYRFEKENIPFVFRPINRLDRNTSGLLIVAKNQLSAGRLTKSLQNHLILKEYLAILDGELPKSDGKIEVPLHRTEKSIIVREVCPADAPDADYALTEFRVLAKGNGHTLVSARPITGRTHQLRVHFAYLGYPITGDDLYGTASEEIGRHALHAVHLRFPHPTTKALSDVYADPPTDFLKLQKKYFPDFVFERSEPDD